MTAMIEERLCNLRKSMQRTAINCYLIPTSDYHDSEYVSSFFMVRKYFSGFTGSAGTLVVTEEEVAQNSVSYTGKYIKDMLQKELRK